MDKKFFWCIYLFLTLTTCSEFLSSQESVDQSTQFTSQHVKPSATNPEEDQQPEQEDVALFQSAEHVDPSEENLSKEDEKNSPHKFTGGVTFISDYRSRGISQTMRRPAVQGEMTYTHKSGLL